MISKECRLATVEVENIDYGNRGREDYKDIVGLATSIKERGLIHPIAVCDHPKVEGKYLLLAGGRRLRAHEYAGITEIDCKIFPKTLTKLEIKTIELTENLHRENLEYHEEVRMKKEIVNLMEELYGRKTSTSPDATGVSKSDVAKMLGISHAKLSQDLKLAETIENLPDVDWTRCKNQAEATKLQANITNIVVRQEAVKRFEKEVTKDANNGIQKLHESFIVGDFFEKVKKLPAKTFQLVEIDPPYAIDLAGKKAKKGAGNYLFGEDGYNEIDPKSYAIFMKNTFKECYRVMSANSFLICWFSPDPWYQPMLNWMKRAGFTVRGLPCVWIKGESNSDGQIEKTVGQTMTPMRHLGSAVEYFFYARKGDPHIGKMGRTNVFSYKQVTSTKKVHPTERPYPLIYDILETFSIEGSRILVPFAGSGKTLIAAYQQKKFAVGFDLGQAHKDGFVELLQRKEIL